MSAFMQKSFSFEFLRKYVLVDRSWLGKVIRKSEKRELVMGYAKIYANITKLRIRIAEDKY